MSSLVRSVLGAALLLTGASAVMAQSANPPVAGQPVQTNNAPVANQTVQTGASTATAATNNAAQPKKPQRAGIADNSDPYGGNDPNSTAGARAFFTPQY